MSQISKVVVIGIDGLDNELLSRWVGDLPNLSILRRTTPEMKFYSIFPPDTTPAWATIYTGVSPAGHGIINFVNPADKEGGYEPLKVNDDLLRGKTFWDAVSNDGHPVCVILPMIVSPGWPVNGKIISRSTSPSSPKSPLTAFPDSIIDDYNPSAEKLNLVGGFYGKSQKRELVKLLKDRLIEEARISLEMMKNEEWALYFTYFSALDEIQHVFWPYCDQNHPRYPGPNEFENVILDFYREMDRIVGRFLAACSPEDRIIVISDHGQGARPSLIFNINEWLRRKGYLYANEQQGHKSKNLIKSTIKKGLLSFVGKYGAGRFLMSISKRFPFWKKLLAPSSGINWTKTKAYVSDLSAVKNYSYGGIRLNKADSSEETELMINDILSSLKDLRIPDTDIPLVTFASRREDLYNGPYIDKYPEILLELDERYGIGWSFSGELFDDEGGIFQLKPGTHRRSTPVFLSRNIEKELLKDHMELQDIAPLIKKLFGINGS